MSTNAVANFANRPPGAGGRPLGARTRLSHRLIEDLSEIWEQQGPTVLAKMASRDPTRLAQLAYSTLPKDVLISIEQKAIPGGLEPEDWAVLMRVLDTIKSAIPAGSNAPPVEILNVIETALRAHFARQIEA
jgi:hypothetical protein